MSLDNSATPLLPVLLCAYYILVPLVCQAIFAPLLDFSTHLPCFAFSFCFSLMVLQYCIVNLFEFCKFSYSLLTSLYIHSTQIKEPRVQTRLCLAENPKSKSNHFYLSLSIKFRLITKQIIYRILQSLHNFRIELFFSFFPVRHMHGQKIVKISTVIGI